MRVTRVQVRCIGRREADDETLMIPLQPGWTVSDLLEAVRQRVRRIRREDMQELELDGGRLDDADVLDCLLEKGDTLCATRAPSPTRSARAWVNEAPSPSQTPWQRGNEVERRQTEVKSAPDSESSTPPMPGAGPVVATAQKEDSESSTPPIPGAGPVAAVARKESESSRSRSRDKACSAQREWYADTVAPPEGIKRWPPLLQAAYDGDFDAAQAAIKSSADVNVTAPTAGRRTPLYYATRFEYPDIVRLLLGHPNVDVDRQMKASKSKKGEWTSPRIAAQEAEAITEVRRVWVEFGLLDKEEALAVPTLSTAWQPQLWSQSQWYASEMVSLTEPGPKVAREFPSLVSEYVGFGTGKGSKETALRAVSIAKWLQDSSKQWARRGRRESGEIMCVAVVAHQTILDAVLQVIVHGNANKWEYGFPEFQLRKGAITEVVVSPHGTEVLRNDDGTHLPTRGKK